MPTVSVIIPCFNLGEYLDETVDSVLAQTYQDFEILIVDDGSTDPDTVRLLSSFARPNTRVFHTTNRGLPSARNLLIAHAQGVYLCALDADDKLHPHFLEKTVEVLERDPSASFVSTHLRMFGTHDDIWPADARADLVTLLCEDTVITPALVRRAAVEALGGYDTGMPHQGDEDWDLWLSLVEAGHRGVILPEVLFYYRRRPGSMVDVCTSGPVHLELLDYVVRKHHGSYRSHLMEVLLRKEDRISALRRSNVALEEDIAAHLVPLVARRREELASLRRRLERVQALSTLSAQADRISELERRMADRDEEVRGLRHAYEVVDHERAALKASASWRVTAPLRRCYDALRWIAGRWR